MVTGELRASLKLWGRNRVFRGGKLDGMLLSYQEHLLCNIYFMMLSKKYSSCLLYSREQCDNRLGGTCIGFNAALCTAILL